ncbi:MAG TPA: N-acyl-L-homoserine lactone synthetase, partial [Nitrospirae bacterium]|nr:N-acyl-L-homoserine lactone synthetase [Nitrospirota bacterium]
MKWVPGREDLLETDDYDEYAVSFGVFDRESRLAAYLRLIMPQRPFML